MMDVLRIQYFFRCPFFPEGTFLNKKNFITKH